MPACVICGGEFDYGAWGAPDQSREQEDCDCGQNLGPMETADMTPEEVLLRCARYVEKVQEAMMPELTDDLESDIDYEGEN
jgi:hypothetical protein